MAIRREICAAAGALHYVMIAQSMFGARRKDGVVNSVPTSFPSHHDSGWDDLLVYFGLTRLLDQIDAIFKSNHAL